MPRHLQPHSLYVLSSKEVATLLFRGCVFLDRLEQVEELRSVGFDVGASIPTLTIPVRRRGHTKEEVYRQLTPRHRPVLAWLTHLPDRVVVEVVQEVLAKLELHLVEDMDNKLVLIKLILNKLVNIERKRVNDFYFGLHSLLSIIQGFQIDKLHFSKRLWYCLSQYGEITSCRQLTQLLVTSLPGLTGLTSLNLAHLATDQLVFTVSRHLASLASLDLAGSAVTDNAIRFLAGEWAAWAWWRWITNYEYILQASSPGARGWSS